MLGTCALKADCRHAPAAANAALVAKYGRNVPRYTSYPTAAQFTVDISKAHYDCWLAVLAPHIPVSLYVHVPFCDRLCWYCGCHTSVVRRREPIADYVRMLVREIEIVSDALPENAHASALHLGGGTPNVLSPDDLRTIVEALGERFAFTAPFAFAAELDPRTLTDEWIETAAELGLSRASLGVQDLDPMVQRAINRVQPYSEVERAVGRLRRAGVGSVNLDLMYGLPYQDVATILSTLNKILSLAPERIALFGYAHVPWMKAHQKLLPEDELPDAIERFDQQSAAAERLESAGYVRIGLDHFAEPDDELAIAQRSGLLRRNFQGYTTDRASIIGFGPSSISTLPQGFAQNAAHVPEWRQCIDTGRLATARGLILTAEDRLRGAIIERPMCDLRVDLASVCAAYDRSPAQFARELADLDAMEADGLLSRKGWRIEVAEFGRPFVRVIAAVFDTGRSSVKAGRHASAV